MNKKNRTDVLKDGRRIVRTEKSTITTPNGVVKNPSSVPGNDKACHAFLTGAGKKRFDGVK
jgi:hypothetical protein